QKAGQSKTRIASSASKFALTYDVGIASPAPAGNQMSPFQLIALHSVPAAKRQIAGYRTSSDQSGGIRAFAQLLAKPVAGPLRVRILVSASAWANPPLGPERSEPFRPTTLEQSMAREELNWQNIHADDLPAAVKKSFDAMVEAEAAFKADLEKLL